MQGIKFCPFCGDMGVKANYMPQLQGGKYELECYSCGAICMMDDPEEDSFEEPQEKAE